MSYIVEPIEDESEDLYPYTVKVNGVTLMGELGERRFKDSFAAAVAGAKEVDRLKARDRGKTFVTGACPLGFECAGRAQCWEPCGELGKSEAHAVAVTDEEAGFPPRTTTEP